MWVNNKDLENEKTILKEVKDLVPKIKDYDWQQSKSKSALYDFRGYCSGEVVAGLDVKVRDIGVNQYPNYFISSDKVKVVREHPEYDFFVVYYFEASGVVRIYHLNDLELPEKELNFKHKRAGHNMKSIVHLVDAGQFCGEVYLT